MSTARKRTAGSRAAATATARSKALAKTVKRVAASAPKVVKAARKAAVAAADVRGEALRVGQDQVDQAASTLFRGYGEVAAFSTGNVEALMLSGSIVARGAGDIGTAWLGVGQRSLQSGAALTQAIAGVRTLQELVALQTDLARTTLERLLSESLRLSELSARVANEAAAPLQARISTAFGLLLKRAAA